MLTGNGTWVAGNSFSQWITNGNTIYNLSHVAIDTSASIYPLYVKGNAVVNGNIFSQNLDVANSLSIGSITISHGMVDTIKSTATQLQLASTSVNATAGFSAGTSVTAGSTGPAPIIISSGSITSASGNLSFGSNNLKTMGTVNADSVNMVNMVSSGTVTMTGVAQPDTMPDLMQIDKTGKVSALTPINLSQLVYSNSNWQTDPCPGPPAPGFVGWLSNNGGTIDNNNLFHPYLFTSTTCAWVGIGTNTPGEPFDISIAGPSSVNAVFRVGTNNTVFTNGLASSDFSYLTQTGDNGIFWSDKAGYNQNSGFVIAPHSNSTAGIRIDAYGNVGIGTGTPQYPLDVIGTIHGNEVKVCILPNCDFVFNRAYYLMPLDSLSDFLNQNHHLPGIPSVGSPYFWAIQN